MPDPLKEAMITIDKGIEEMMDAKVAPPVAEVDYSGGKSQIPSTECRELSDTLRERYNSLQLSRDDITKAMVAINAALDQLK